MVLDNSLARRSQPQGAKSNPSHTNEAALARTFKRAKIESVEAGLFSQTEAKATTVMQAQDIG